MGIEKGNALLNELIKKAGGCAVLDGGFSTQLEKHGACMNDSLWTALCLIKDPHLVKMVHLEYLEAGADILLTSSYQATVPGFVSRGFSIEEAEAFLRKSVKLAVDARDKFWDANQGVEGHNYNRALVAASIGSYGAYLADGSEYSGDYGQSVTTDTLKDFHRRRLQVLIEAGPDLLAFETISNKLEAQAIVELLEDENVQIPSWMSFSCRDGEHTASGESFDECIELLNKSDKISALGINCSPPQFILTLIEKFNKLTDKPIIVYPNSGGTYDGVTKTWQPSKCTGDENFEISAVKWRDAGAKIIGGCCETSTVTIQALSKVLKSDPKVIS